MQRRPSTKFLTMALGLIIGANAAVGQAPSQSLSPFDQELANVEMRFIQALQDKNVAYAERAAAADFQGVALNGDSFARWELMNDARDGLATDMRLYDLKVVRLTDNCAVVSYSQILPGDHPRYRHVSDTWVKDAGQWKLKFEQRTPRVWSALDID